MDQSNQVLIAVGLAAQVKREVKSFFFLCLRAHVNDISTMTALLVISLSVGERGRREKMQRERVKHCLQQPVIVCVCG